MNNGPVITLASYQSLETINAYSYDGDIPMVNDDHRQQVVVSFSEDYEI